MLKYASALGIPNDSKRIDDKNSLLEVFHGMAKKQYKLVEALLSKGPIDEEFSQDESKEEMIARPTKIQTHSQTLGSNARIRIIDGASQINFDVEYYFFHAFKAYQNRLEDVKCYIVGDTSILLRKEHGCECVSTSPLPRIPNNDFCQWCLLETPV